MAKWKSRSQPTYNVVVELSRALRVNPQWAKVICKQEQTKIHPQQYERLINSFKQQIHHIIAPERGFKLYLVFHRIAWSGNFHFHLTVYPSVLLLPWQMFKLDMFFSFNIVSRENLTRQHFCPVCLALQF